MRTLLWAGLLCMIHLAGVAQPPAAVKDQATKMGQALINGDFATFTHYTWPGIVKMMGGPDKLKSQLATMMDQVRKQGMQFEGISFGEPSKILTVGKQLQCTIPQHTEIKTPKGTLVSTSTLIGVSDDGGKDWTFIDTSNKDIATIRKIFPQLSTSIVIPPAQAPVMAH